MNKRGPFPLWGKAEYSGHVHQDWLARMVHSPAVTHIPRPVASPNQPGVEAGEGGPANPGWQRQPLPNFSSCFRNPPGRPSHVGPRRSRMETSAGGPASRHSKYVAFVVCCSRTDQTTRPQPPSPAFPVHIHTGQALGSPPLTATDPGSHPPSANLNFPCLNFLICKVGTRSAWKGLQRAAATG